MFEYLQGLHPILSYSLVVMLVVAAVVLSLFTKVKWEKQSLSIGDEENPDQKKGDKDLEDATKKPRNCVDCIFYILALREKFEVDYITIKDNILKDQMNFAEQKLSEIKTTATTEFTKKLRDIDVSGGKDFSIEEQFFRETTRYELFSSVLREVMHIIKDEIRRSFKENGYFDFPEGEFSNYLKNKMDYLESLAKNHFAARYPSYNKILPLTKINEIYEDKRKELEVILREVFTLSKGIKTKADNQIAKKKEEFRKKVDNFLPIEFKAQDGD